MALNDFKDMVENARKIIVYLQRKLDKMIDMSQSAYNDKIKVKFRYRYIKKIVEDLSLDLILKETGYSETFSIYGINKYKNQSLIY